MASRILWGSLILALVVLTSAPAMAQHPSNSRYGNGLRMPLSPIPATGEPVAPFFEGWLRNDDGTFTFSFGYFNLNGEEILDIPIEPDNVIEPAEYDGVQPTHFPSSPRREQGVFHVTVPASYEDGRQRVVWTITANGATLSVPARVGYEALQLAYDPMAMGSTPPEVRLDRDGMVGRHVDGIWSEPRTGTVGTPLVLTLVGGGNLGAGSGRWSQHRRLPGRRLGQAPGPSGRSHLRPATGQDRGRRRASDDERDVYRAR